MDEIFEKRLIERIKNGESPLYSDLVLEYQSRLYSFIRRMVRNDEDARDLTQEAFLLAYRGIGGFAFKSRFSTWLFQIGYNRAINHIKREGRRREIERAWEGPSVAHEPHGAVEMEEIGEAIERHMADLSPGQRTALHLCYREEKSYLEIAGIMSLPVNTVKSHIRRAKEALKNRLAENYGNAIIQTRKEEIP